MSVYALFNPEKNISSQLTFLRRESKNPNGLIDEEITYYKPFNINGTIVKIIKRSIIGIAFSETDCRCISDVSSLALRTMVISVNNITLCECNFSKVDETFRQILLQIKT